jgi:hypothetical protein
MKSKKVQKVKNNTKVTENKATKKKNLLIALEKSLGVVTAACIATKISRITFYTYYNTDELFRQKVDEIVNIAIDFVESKLFENIKNGNVAAQIFYLKTKAKNRGYIERQEVSHNVEQIVIKPYSLSGSTEKI